MIVSTTPRSADGDVQPVPNALAPVADDRRRRTLAVTSAPIERLVDADARSGGERARRCCRNSCRRGARVRGCRGQAGHRPLRGDHAAADARRRPDRRGARRSRRPPTPPGRSRSPSNKQPATTRRSGRRAERCATSRADRGWRHELLHTLRHVSNQVPPLASMFDDPTVGAPAVRGVPDRDPALRVHLADQRSGHRVRDGRPTARRSSNTTPGGGVHRASPSDGTYTLTSKNSPLPITVVNRLNARGRRCEISVDAGERRVRV